MDTGPAVESDWDVIASLEITSGEIAVLDPMSFDSITLKLPPGRYQVAIKRVQYLDEQYTRVSRVRVSNSKGAQLGPQIDRVGVDAATLGIVDASALSDDNTEEWERHTAEIESSWQSGEDCGYVQWGDADSAIMAHVSTGYGDGTFPVCELTLNQQRAGFEIEFIPTGTAYPFKK
ncbi:MAG TPA: hypothetical protein VH253_08580 [Phycisphaerae bacterium]|nr:hypothetical protein [Phycisphaerae bacterium]